MGEFLGSFKNWQGKFSTELKGKIDILEKEIKELDTEINSLSDGRAWGGVGGALGTLAVTGILCALLGPVGLVSFIF